MTSKRRAFAKTVDGEDCPIAVCCQSGQFIALAEGPGLECSDPGAYVSTWELRQLASRYQALEHLGLDPESWRFLSELTFDERLWPIHRGRRRGRLLFSSHAASRKQ